MNVWVVVTTDGSIPIVAASPQGALQACKSYLSTCTNLAPSQREIMMMDLERTGSIPGWFKIQQSELIN